MCKTDAFSAKNCKYALDENFHGYFCPRRRASKFCHPDFVRYLISYTIIIQPTVDHAAWSVALNAPPERRQGGGYSNDGYLINL